MNEGLVFCFLYSNNKDISKTIKDGWKQSIIILKGQIWPMKPKWYIFSCVYEVYVQEFYNSNCLTKDYVGIGRSGNFGIGRSGLCSNEIKGCTFH